MAVVLPRSIVPALRTGSGLALLFAALGAAGLAGAQYFGGNKVRYDPKAFEVLATEHFDVHYYPEELPAARIVARMAERWYVRLSRVLSHELSRRQDLPRVPWKKGDGVTFRSD